MSLHSPHCVMCTSHKCGTIPYFTTNKGILELPFFIILNELLTACLEYVLLFSLIRFHSLPIFYYEKYSSYSLKYFFLLTEKVCTSSFFLVSTLSVLLTEEVCSSSFSLVSTLFVLLTEVCSSSFSPVSTSLFLLTEEICFSSFSLV